jgi:hypothetical protein
MMISVETGSNYHLKSHKLKLFFVDFLGVAGVCAFFKKCVFHSFCEAISPVGGNPFFGNPFFAVTVLPLGEKNNNKKSFLLFVCR